jgi:hypothetical protein
VNIPVVKYEGAYPVVRFDRKRGRTLILKIIPWLPIWRIWCPKKGWRTTY